MHIRKISILSALTTRFHPLYIQVARIARILPDTKHPLLRRGMGNNSRAPE